MTTASATADPHVVLPLRRQGDRPPLFCIHAGSGFGLPYLTLLPHIGADSPVYALQARGVAAPAPLPASLDAMVTDYVTQIRRVRPEGPYRLLGWCLGGRVAFEIGCRLRAEGETVDPLILIGAYPPGGDPVPEAPTMLLNMLRRPGDVDPELARLCEEPWDFAAISDYLNRTDHPMRRLSPSALAAVFEVYRNGETLYRTAVERTFDGDVVGVTAHGEPDVGAAWRSHITGAATGSETSSPHGELLDAGRVAELGALLRHHLD